MRLNRLLHKDAVNGKIRILCHISRMVRWSLGRRKVCDIYVMSGSGVARAGGGSLHRSWALEPSIIIQHCYLGILKGRSLTSIVVTRIVYAHRTCWMLPRFDPKNLGPRFV